MSYLKEFLTQIHLRDYQKFLVLWEEYTMDDSVNYEEFRQILNVMKECDMASSFGKIVESAIPLWETLKDEEEAYEILRLLIDLQTSQSHLLAEKGLEALKKRYGHTSQFNDWLRMVGLRQRENFQGALSKYDLLAHFKKGNFVFHHGGWGAGEIMEVSFVREQLTIEFENTSGKKDLSFSNAFKTLVPLSSTHFLSRRFSDADQLEKEGMEDPVALIKMLLKDTGPKTAIEIKDELCSLVISDKNWTKWWQAARARLKKDPFIETPSSLKAPFFLRTSQLSPQEKLKNTIQETLETQEMIQLVYNFVRDYSPALKDIPLKETLQNRLIDALSREAIKESEKMEIYLILEQFFEDPNVAKKIEKLVVDQSEIVNTIHEMQIAALKKRAIAAVKTYRHDWIDIYLNLLHTLNQAPLREYLLKELNQKGSLDLLKKNVEKLLESPQKSPDLFFWYFNQLVGDSKDSIPFKNEEGQHRFFESFFLLIHAIENQVEYRDLLKKMYNALINDRYALFRQLLKGTSLSFAQELLLLISKCQSFTDHDKKILRSLIEVVHPSTSLPKKEKEENEEEREIWTTEAGYLKIQERIKQIGTVEVIENAREIEAARALGDLRENSEFKFAQEKRARLQSELKTLSDQLSKAKIITPEDVHSSEVSIGHYVFLKDKNGKQITYLILGPWDANTEDNILSFNSKLAQAMIGKKVGEHFTFREDTFEIQKIENYFKV